MTTTTTTDAPKIPSYLKSHLEVAETLPAQLPDGPEETVANVQARLRALVQLVTVRDLQILKLERQLDRLRRKLLLETVPHT